MSEIEEELEAETHGNYLFVYAQIAFNQLRRFANIESPASLPEGWRKYTADSERSFELTECRVLSVLATALFIEAYAFDYCARKRSASFAKTYLDKLDTPAKWIVTTQLLCPPGLDPGNELFERLKKLFGFRNKLVHYKTKKGESVYRPPEFPQELHPSKNLNLIIDILSELKRLDASEESSADLYLRHIESWFKYCAKDRRFYPIPWEV
jgi:hypothetical protein